MQELGLMSGRRLSVRFSLKRAEYNVQPGAEILGIPAAENGPAGVPALKSRVGPQLRWCLPGGGWNWAARPVYSFGQSSRGLGWTRLLDQRISLYAAYSKPNAGHRVSES